MASNGTNGSGSGHDHGPDDTEVAEETIVQATTTIAGDLATFLTDRIKNLPKVWTQMTEYEQETIIRAANTAVNEAVRQAVNLIAADGRAVLRAKLESVQIKDGIKGVLAMAQHDPLRHALVDAQGSTVLLVVADYAPYMGGERPKATPDQAEMDVTVDGGEAGEGEDGEAVDGPLFEQTPAGEAVAAEAPPPKESQSAKARRKRAEAGLEAAP